MKKLLPPALLSLLIVATAPFMGVVRDLLLEALPGAFVRALALGFAALVAALLLLAILRIRHRRWLRYGGLALALGLIAVQGFGFGTGIPQVDVVERIHILEYGLLSFLVYRALAGAGDLSAVLLPALWAAGLGTLDEFVQWLVPVRTGDLRDVAINLFAGACGVLFGLSLTPPRRLALRLSPGHGKAVCWTAAGVVLGFAAFLHCAHLGYEIVDPEIGRFRSWFSEEELARLKEAKAAEWQREPPKRLEILAKEDYYLTEAAWHVNHRNAAYGRGDYFHAWKENRILETYYPAFLEVESFHGSGRHRLPAEQREEIAARRPRPDPVPYVSPVLGHRIFLAPSRTTLWTVAVSVALALLVLPLVSPLGGRRPGRDAAGRGSA